MRLSSLQTPRPPALLGGKSNTCVLPVLKNSLLLSQSFKNNSEWFCYDISSLTSHRCILSVAMHFLIANFLKCSLTRSFSTEAKSSLLQTFPLVTKARNSTQQVLPIKTKVKKTSSTSAFSMFSFISLWLVMYLQKLPFMSLNTYLKTEVQSQPQSYLCYVPFLTHTQAGGAVKFRFKKGRVREKALLEKLLTGPILT